MMILYIIYIYIHYIIVLDIFKYNLHNLGVVSLQFIGHRQAGASEETAQAWCGGALWPSF